MDVFYGDGVSFFAQKKVGRLVADEDIIIKIPYRRDVLPTFLDFIGYLFLRNQ